jgi:hypothetical protein
MWPASLEPETAPRRGSFRDVRGLDHDHDVHCGSNSVWGVVPGSGSARTLSDRRSAILPCEGGCVWGRLTGRVGAMYWFR